MATKPRVTRAQTMSLQKFLNSPFNMIYFEILKTQRIRVYIFIHQNLIFHQSRASTESYVRLFNSVNSIVCLFPLARIQDGKQNSDVGATTLPCNHYFAGTEGSRNIDSFLKILNIMLISGSFLPESCGWAPNHLNQLR